MLKCDFIEKVHEMGEPSIREFDPDDNAGLLSACWIISDKDNLSRKFCTPIIRLSHSEYLKGDLSQYYKRESATREKYYRWFTEANQRGPGE